MKKSVPDRWLDYKAIGNVIQCSNFVAFKVPLHKNVSESLSTPERHTTHDVINAIPRLGLVINLTNTQNDWKYYQPQDWERYGIHYKWIKTQGHVTPSQSVLLDFCSTVKRFLMDHPQANVGVHCTHGVNRTGYLICSYMVLCNNVAPSDALRNFADARGHPVERHNYINAVMHHHSNTDLKHAVSAIGRISRWDGGTASRWNRSATSRWDNNTNNSQDNQRRSWRNNTNPRSTERQSWRSGNN